MFVGNCTTHVTVWWYSVHMNCINALQMPGLRWAAARVEISAIVIEKFQFSKILEVWRWWKMLTPIHSCRDMQMPQPGFQGVRCGFFLIGHQSSVRKCECKFVVKSKKLTHRDLFSSCLHVSQGLKITWQIVSRTTAMYLGCGTHLSLKWVYIWLDFKTLTFRYSVLGLS